MQGIMLILVLAVVVEAVIEYTKSIVKMFTDGEVKTGVTQIVAIIISTALCILAKADLFQVLDISLGNEWIGLVLTGLFASRGANYVSDFMWRLQNVQQSQGDE